MATSVTTKAPGNSGAAPGFEADKLRGNLNPAEYKHVVPGLNFLKYISDADDRDEE